MTRTINLNPTYPVNVLHATPAVLVYTKADWADPWTLRDDLLVQECVWTTAPAVSTATLEYRFGRVLQPGSTYGFDTYTPITAQGYYVLILYGSEDGIPRSWCGYAESAVVVHRNASLAGDPPSGIQHVPCYGFERALQYAHITTTVHENPDSTAATKWLRSEHPAMFNSESHRTNESRFTGNRTENEVDLYTIAGTMVQGHVLANPSSPNQKWWSTRDIFKHICLFHLPTGDRQRTVLPFSIPNDLTMLPDWDKPKLETETKKLFDVLTELLSADRALGWRLETIIAPIVAFGATPPVVNELRIVPFTRLSANLSLPSIGDMLANDDIIDWVSDLDGATDGELQFDDSETVSQIVVRGPREIGVATFTSENFETAVDDPFILNDYNTKASSQAGWAGLEFWEKVEANEQERANPDYDALFTEYIIKPDWDGKVNIVPNIDTVFEQIEGNTYVPYLGTAKFLPDLPLFANCDYSGAVDPAVEEKGRFRLPILIYGDLLFGAFKAFHRLNIPLAAHSFQKPNALPIQVQVTPSDYRGTGIRISIGGAPKHCLDPDFVPNDGDVENANPDVWGGWKLEYFRFTMAMVGDRRPTYMIPANPTGDLIRRKVITLEHPSLELVRIAKRTAVGRNDDGSLKFSDGGILRNPMPQIEALARLAAANHIDARRNLQISSGHVLGNLQPGNMIGTYNTQTAGTVINAIRILSSTSEGDSPPPLTMTIQATTNPLDIVSLVGRVPVPKYKQL